jgi:hypothetical protein
MPLTGPTGPIADWTMLGALSEDLRQVAVSPSGVWAVTRQAFNAGQVSRSVDNGNAWATRSMPAPSSTLAGAAYGGTNFVVAEGGDRIFSSPDGLTWTLRLSGSYNHGDSVRYNDGYFVIGSWASNGIIVASPDGVNWTAGAQGSAGGNFVNCGIYVASLNRTFAGGNASQYRYVNAVPTAATAWTGTPTGLLPATPYDVAWSPTASIAVLVGDGGIFSSTDLITWSRRVSTSNFFGVSWCETQFVAVGSAGKISTSPDGVTWTVSNSGTSNNLYGVAAQSGVTLVTGNGGTVLRLP